MQQQILPGHFSGNRMIASALMKYPERSVPKQKRVKRSLFQYEDRFNRYGDNNHKDKTATRPFYPYSVTQNISIEASIIYYF